MSSKKGVGFSGEETSSYSNDGQVIIRIKIGHVYTLRL